MRHSDLDLLFQKGQEFTRRDDHHTHCVILELLPRTMSYRVCDTSTGHILSLRESILLHHFVQSCARDQEDALALLGTRRGHQRQSE
jgi:hypothetical protein